MTYATGGPIEAFDYNTFATLSGSMNQVYADLYPGATTLPNAGYGYGQTPALVPVAIGDDILASEWEALFETMRKSGTHQGTTVVPPLPVGNPIPGDLIEAFNSPTAFADLVALLHTNRFNLAPLQSTLLIGSNFVQGVPSWTSSLVFTCQVNFGSWNNARYFFNSGGSLNLNGTYSPVSTPEDTQWSSMLTAMSPLVFDYNSTTPNSGTGGTSIGFYNLTTTYQTLYNKTYGSGYYYSTSYVRVEGKYAAAAGTNGLIDLKISLINTDPTPNLKTSTTTYRLDNVRATGAITYPGPAVTVSAIGANNGFTAT